MASEAQTKQRDRAFRIWRLRGLWSQVHMLTGSRLLVARAMVDQELHEMGAESESVRQETRQAKLIADLEKADEHGDLF